MKLSNFESIGDNTGAAAMVMKVTKIEENGGAAASGIIVGDLLISLQNVDISSNEIFTKVRKEGGSRQSAKIFRNTDFLEVHLPDGKLGLDLSLADEAAEGPYQVSPNVFGSNCTTSRSTNYFNYSPITDRLRSNKSYSSYRIILLL